MFVQLNGIKPCLFNLDQLRWMRIVEYFKMGEGLSKLIIRTKDLEKVEVIYDSLLAMKMDVRKIEEKLRLCNKTMMGMENYLICLEEVISFNFGIVNDKTLTIVMTNGEKQNIEFNNPEVLNENYKNMTSIFIQEVK